MIKRLLILALLFSPVLADVTEDTFPAQHATNGSSTEFSFDFSIEETSDLYVVLRETSTGDETNLVEGSNYTVSAVNNDYSTGGTVTTISTYASGFTLTIGRDTPKTQENELSDQDTGTLRLATLESSLDKLTRLTQELQEEQDRCLRFPRTEAAVDELEVSIDRAGKYQAFASGTGLPITTAGTSETTTHGTWGAYVAGNAVQWGAEWTEILNSSAGLTELYTVDHVLVSDHGNDVDVAIDAMDGNSVLVIDVLDGAAVLSTSKTLTATQKLVNLPGCYITGTGSPTLTIPSHKNIQAVGQIFDDRDTMQVSFTEYAEVRASWFGDGLTEEPIQAAFDSLDTTNGGEVFIDREGTHVIDLGLYVYDVNNLTIKGFGIDRTILHGTIVGPNDPGTITKPPGADTSWGVLTIGSAAGDRISDVVCKNFTIKLTGGTPLAFGTDVANETYYIKNTHYINVDNIRFENVKFEGSRWEQCYSDGSSSTAPVKVFVESCWFKDAQHDAFNINTASASDTTIQHCYFEENNFGVQLIQERILINDNTFFRTEFDSVLINEATYPQPDRNQGACVISNNIFDQCGYGNAGVTTTRGIDVRNGRSVYTDGTEDLGVYITDNVLTNFIGAGQQLDGIKLSGSGIISGNRFSGISGTVTNSDAIVCVQGASSGAVRSTVYIEHNSIDRTVAATKWARGINITGDDTAKYFLHGNRVLEVASTSHALNVVNGTLATTPYVSIDGDILNGYIQDATSWNQPVQTVLNFNSEWFDKPLYADNTTRNFTFFNGGIHSDELATTIVDINSVEIKALAATPAVLVATTNTGYLTEFVSATLILDYGSEVLAEPSAPDDLAIEYDNGTGTQIVTFDTTGFITSSADAMLIINAASVNSGASAVLTATNTAKNIVLINTGGEYTGNASNDTGLRVITVYRIHRDLGL